MTPEEWIRRLVDLAWTGGVLDTRGRFVVLKLGPRRWEPRVFVEGALGDQEMLQRLRELHGGHVSRPSSRQKIRWELAGVKRVDPFLVELLPHMHHRVAPAQALATFTHHVAAYKLPSFGERKLPNDECVIRAELALLVAQARGPWR